MINFRKRKSMYDVMRILDRAAATLSECNDAGTFEQWMTYLLETIESEQGEEALGMTMRLLDARFAVGQW